MRKVIFGKTVESRVQYCKKLAQEFQKQGLSVVSNNHFVADPRKFRIDEDKEQVILNSGPANYRAYQSLPFDEADYNPIHLLYYGKALKYLAYKGDVLILVDIDALLCQRFLNRLADSLSETGCFRDLFRHVVITGNNWDITFLIEDLTISPVTFITNPDTLEVKEITEIPMEDNVYDEYLEKILEIYQQ